MDSAKYSRRVKQYVDLWRLFSTIIVLVFLSIGALGERLDNFLGGNPNPTFGQIYGGAPGVGGYGGNYGYSYYRW